MGGSIWLQLCWALGRVPALQNLFCLGFTQHLESAGNFSRLLQVMARRVFHALAATSDQPAPSCASHKTPSNIFQIWELPVIFKLPEQSLCGGIFQLLFLISALCLWFFPIVQRIGFADVFPCLGTKLLNVSWNSLIFLAFQRMWNYIHYSGCPLLFPKEYKNRN